MPLTKVEKTLLNRGLTLEIFGAILVGLGVMLFTDGFNKGFASAIIAFGFVQILTGGGAWVVSNYITTRRESR